MTIGALLLALSGGVRTWAYERERRGLRWETLGAAQRLVDAVGRATATPSDWGALTVLASAGELDDEQIAAMVAQIEGQATPPTGAQNMCVAIAHDATTSVDLRRRIAALLLPPPTPTVRYADGRNAARRGESVVVTIPASPAPISYGTSMIDPPAVTGLWSIRGATIDGVPVVLEPAERRRPGTPAEYALSALSDRGAGLTFACRADAAPGTHMLEVQLDAAMVDANFADALCWPHGTPGPASRWGTRTATRLVRLTVPIVVEEATGAAEAGTTP